ncbi:MAG: hypothetical protein AAF720_15520 [Pseudomonadota bacterium]
MNGPRLGGAFLLIDLMPWMVRKMSTVSVRPSQKLEREQLHTISKGANYFTIVPPDVDYNKVFWTLPLSSMMEVTHSSPTIGKNMLR